MRVFRRPILLVALILGVTGLAHAQFGQIGSYNRPKTNNYPTVSPYLNLGRGGDQAVNYYGIVRPQMDTNRAFQQLDPALFGGDPRFGGGAGAAIGPDGNPIPGRNNYYPNQAIGMNTGHPATFFYYSSYYQFPNSQRGGGAGGGVGGGNNAFGRPNTQSIPFFTGNNGIIMPVNPAGANPLGGQLFGTGQPLAPGMVVMP